LRVGVVVRNACEASLDGLPYAPSLPVDLVRVALGYDPTLSIYTFMRAFLVLLLAVAASPSHAQTGETLDAVLDEAHAAGTFDGVVLVGRGDRVVYHRAVGTADRSWGVPNAADTRFPWASVTKQLTATLVLQLVDEGHLVLSTPLGDILPALPPDGAGRVTVRQLLQNTSGLPIDPVPDYTVLTDSAFAAALDAALGSELAFEPGSRFQYSNTDYHVLGLVVEALTGQTYEEALRARILDPLGMTETCLVRHDRVEPRVPTGYLTDEGGGAEPVPYTRLARFGASGGLAGSVEDLFRYDRALLGDRLIPRALRDEMFAGDPALGYAGLSVWRYPRDVAGRSVTLVERQGLIAGYRALNLLAPAEDLVLIVLSNNSRADLSNTYAADGLSYRLLRAALAADG
jgi:CubicO group peptidase (beta-lactamase class C family)